MPSLLVVCFLLLQTERCFHIVLASTHSPINVLSRKNSEHFIVWFGYYWYYYVQSGMQNQNGGCSGGAKCKFFIFLNFKYLWIYLLFWSQIFRNSFSCANLQSKLKAGKWKISAKKIDYAPLSLFINFVGFALLQALYRKTKEK